MGGGESAGYNNINGMLNLAHAPRARGQGNLTFECARARFCDAVARRVGWRSVGGKSSGRRSTPAGDPGVDWGGVYVHAEESRATFQGCGEVADMRGSHNDATLAS